MSVNEIRNILNLLETIALMELTDKVKQQQFDRLQSENPNQDPDEIKKYINAWDTFSQTFPPNKKDITKLPFTEIVKLIRDASFKSSLKGKETPFHKQPKINRDMDLIYNKNGLEILKGDMKEKCILYGKNSKWCISRNDAQNMFYTYRMRLDEPTFYFVFDTDKPETDIWHRVVIYVDKNGIYKVATSNNPGDIELTWEEIERKQPKLRGLQKLFVHQPLSDEERSDYEKYKNEVDLTTYQNYSLEEKYKYIKFGHELYAEMQDATPTELIGVYAKGLPTKITNKTLNRLNGSDLKKVISDIVDENNNISPVVFYRDVLQTPWHLSGLPENIVEQAHKKIATSSDYSYEYANAIIRATKDTTQVPDFIVKGIATSSGDSYRYANAIIRATKDTTKVPDFIVKSIATSSGDSYSYANDIINETKDTTKVPDFIVKSIATSSGYSYHYANDIINKTKDTTKVPDFIVKSIATSSDYSYEYANAIITATKDTTKVPDFIVKSIATSSFESYLYANAIIRATKDTTKVPDFIVKSIANNSGDSYRYANDIINETKDTTKVPDFIVKSIATSSGDSYRYANDIINETKDLAKVPDFIVKSIANNSFESYLYANAIITATQDTTQVPDFIVKSIATSSDYSYRYANDIITATQDLAKVPDIIVKSIATSSGYSYHYANDIITATQNTTQVPDIIVKGIATSSDYSYRYANDIINETKDLAKVPDIIVKGIATSLGDSYRYANAIIRATQDTTQVPDFIVKTIKQNDIYYNDYKQLISKYTKTETVDLSRLKQLSGIK